MTQQTTNETTERELFIAHQRQIDNVPDYITDEIIMSGELVRHQWVGWQARAALPPTSGEAVQPTANIPQQAPCRNKLINEGAQMWPKSCQRCGIAKCPDGLVPNFPATKPDPAAPVADTGAVAGWQKPTGAMWSAGRDVFLKYARQWDDARTAELASVIGDIAPGAIFNAMRGAGTTPASPAPTADSAVDARDAARWRAMLGSARIRIIGTAGIREPEDGYAHFGMEIWTIYGASLNAEQTQQMQEGNVYAREVLTKYADIAAMSTNTGEGEG